MKSTKKYKFVLFLRSLFFLFNFYFIFAFRESLFLLLIYANTIVFATLFAVGSLFITFLFFFENLVVLVSTPEDELHCILFF